MEQVIQYARNKGWNCYHPLTGERAETILDLYLWRERDLWIETKKMGGKLSIDRIVKGHFVKGQVTVIEEFKAAGIEHYVFYPCDWEEIERVLD